MWTLKGGRDDPNNEVETSSQTQRLDLWVPRGGEGLGSAGAKSCCGVGRRQAPAQHGTQSPGISRSGMDALKDVCTCITESLRYGRDWPSIESSGPSVKIVKSKLLLQNGGQ